MIVFRQGQDTTPIECQHCWIEDEDIWGATLLGDIHLASYGSVEKAHEIFNAFLMASSPYHFPKDLIFSTLEVII